jgi:superfamily II DNA or RNA helicase
VSDFPVLKFNGVLRPSQRDAIEIARRKLAGGSRRLHIVAPPGSGKTVLGLFLWAECIRKPALVLSPNSAIQAQWAARVESFAVGDGKSIAVSGPTADLASSDPDRPGWLTSLTYQSAETRR